jgi:hypothetical protein
VSLKSIDMSLAVHKSGDAGHAQRELQYKPQIDQDALADSNLKTVDTTRQRASKLDESDKSQIRKRQDDKNGKKGKTKGKADRSRASAEAMTGQASDPEHPFKGHHIDLSL